MNLIALLDSSGQGGSKWIPEVAHDPLFNLILFMGYSLLLEVFFEPFLEEPTIHGAVEIRDFPPFGFKTEYGIFLVGGVLLVVVADVLVDSVELICFFHFWNNN